MISCTPSDLMVSSKTIDQSLGHEEMEAVITYLLCAWLNRFVPTEIGLRIIDTGDFRLLDTGDLRLFQT
jgi:hypothetical protein